MILLNKIRTIILEVLVVLVVGYLLQVLVFCIPSYWIEENVYESAIILQQEGVYPSLYTLGTYVDNWTDADCIAVTYNKAFSSPFLNAMNGYENYSSNEENKCGTNNLVDSMNGNVDSMSNHTHLWHGFRIWLRPLLIWFNISQIRCIISCFFLITLCVLYNSLVQTVGNRWVGVAFVMAIGISGLHLESVSLLVFTDVFIAMLAVIVLLNLRNNEFHRTEDVFTITGSLLAFSSMLIIPIVTLMLPLTICLFIHRKEIVREKIKLLFLYSIRWGIGYGIVLISKIAISALASINSQATSQVSRYLGISGDLNFVTRLSTITEVFVRLCNSNKVLIIVSIILLITSFVMVVVKYSYIKYKIPTYILFLVISSSPMVWCFCIAGHVHHNFTLFNFVISSFSLAMGLVYLIEDENEIREV